MRAAPSLLLRTTRRLAFPRSVSANTARVGAPAMNKADVTALKEEVKSAIIKGDSNACPIIVRLAWHASGTFSKADGSGGSNGATMRFEPEQSEGANAGLDIARNLLQPVINANPNVAISDIWQFAGCCAIELSGGPEIDFKFGRTDASSGAMCPAIGRLPSADWPDAAKGAEHLRSVFGRMGMTDEDIVALSGAHTIGACHADRSGYDGPWTPSPLAFDNSYFKLLTEEKWVPKQWDGPLQYEDVSTGKLMMLTTDLLLMKDPEFKKYVEAYAASQTRFFEAFAASFAKLISNGCPAAKQQA